jgi:hypothetical protein
VHRKVRSLPQAATTALMWKTLTSACAAQSATTDNVIHCILIFQCLRLSGHASVHILRTCVTSIACIYCIYRI